ncbi:MAG: SCO family protein [Cytophagales bacterium]|nr:SCO family protein [Cytophagales bacterium]
MKFLRRLFLLTITLLLISACTDKKVAFNSVDITGATYAQDFSLPDVDGKTRTIKDFAGKVVVVFFGYTQCPDVCPTTMAEVSSVKKALGKDGDKLQAVFISIDPERDTAAVLKAYLANFDESFVALRPATPEALADAAKAFKIYYKKVDGKTAGSYTMDHTAASYVFDTKGRVRLFTRYGAGVAPLTNDVRQLLAGN